MKRPLLAVALLYVGGLLCAEFLTVALPSLFAASLGLALAALIWGRMRPLLLFPIILLSGWTNLACRPAVLSPVDLRTIAGEQEQIVTVRGTLVETPYHRVYVNNEM